MKCSEDKLEEALVVGVGETELVCSSFAMDCI